MVILCILILFVSAARADQIDSTWVPHSQEQIYPPVAVDSSDSLSEPVNADSAAADSVILKPHSPAGAMWRSVIFPGWGQLYNDRYLKAAIIGGTEITLIFSSWVQHQRYEEARKEKDWVAADFYKNDRNKFYWWIAGIVLYSMADAYADGHLYDFELDRNLSAGLDPGGFCLENSGGAAPRAVNLHASRWTAVLKPSIMVYLRINF